jgi:tetratricopeptide (TPR) repeat protein
LSRFFLILALALVTFAPRALAGPPADALARAKVHFEAGTRHYDIGSYAEAAREFQTAYELSQHPELLYNIYTALERGGQYAEAADALERYLELATIDPAQRPTLEARLAALRARLAEEPHPDEEEPPIEELTSAEPDEEPAAGKRRLPTLALASYATAGAMALTFGVFAGLALAENGSLEDGCGANESCTRSEVRALRAFNVTADVALALGVAALTTALVSTFVRRDEEPKVQVSFFADRASRGLVLRRSF